jgi:integrase
VGVCLPLRVPCRSRLRPAIRPTLEFPQEPGDASDDLNFCRSRLRPAMIKGRAKTLGLPDTICNHTFRATGITVFRQNGGTVEEAQHIANHASPKTTMPYDRSRDQITLDEVERIMI